MELTEKTVTASISDYRPVPDEKNQYSSEFMETYSVMILKKDSTSVTVGICSPDNTELKKILSHFHEERIIYKLIDHDEFSEFLGKLNADMEDKKLPSSPGGNKKLLLDKIANDAPVINFVNSTIIEGIRKRASDIHLEVFTDSAKVRYRIDGALKTYNEIDPSMFPAVVSRIKIMANLNIMERRHPQDGRISVFLGDDTQDIRVSIVPTAWGESIVLRLLHRKNTHINLDSLGLSGTSLHGIRDLLKIPSGLILATGPTGSGKTTTLNSMLKELDNESLKIITVEDPVEYALDGIDQIQTNEGIGLTFNSILRRILRQDPDVIMIGEIRDIETANIAVRAALTGHLVLSTLHTNDSVSVIDRLTDMGVESFMIAAVLKASMAQRLVRKLCPKCRIKRKANKTEKNIFKKADKSLQYIYDAAGCDKCDGTGYFKRTLIHEYFSVDEEIERLIASGIKHSELGEYLKRSGMVTLFCDGLEKVEQGLTTLAELETTMVFL